MSATTESGGIGRLAALWSLVAVLAGCSGERPPNVVLIAVDTLRADHTSLHGYPRETTPRIDAWAGGGTVFERVQSASSWTKPSVAMLFTGQARVENSGAIPTWQTYLPEWFRAAGYQTAAVVGNPLYVPLAGQPDFERAFGSYAAYDKSRDGLGRNSWPAREITRRGIEWLERRGDEPFFLYLMYFDPHDPYLPEGGLAFEPFADEERARDFRGALPPEHVGLFDEEIYRGIERRIALYDSEVRQADRGIGALLDYLDGAGLSEDTLVVLTADHGEGLWQRAALPGENYKDHAYFPQLYFDHGVMLHSEQVHVPLVLRGPGVPAGERRDAPASLLDVVPTLLGLAGIERPQGLDGHDLFAPDGPRPAEIVSVCSRSTSLTLEGRWRLHQPREYRVERDGALPELYDLLSDPGERQPLDDPERMGAMQAHVEAWLAHHSAGPALPGMSAEERARLNALGYADEVEEQSGSGTAPPGRAPELPGETRR